MKLSIVISVYNKEKYIGKLLSQLKQQLCEGVEVIVVDDASSDNSVKIIDEYKRVFTIIKHKENQYVCRTRNDGLFLAKGDYITFIDGDDEILPNFVTTILNDIKTNHDGYFYDYEINNVRCNEPVEKGFNAMVWSKVYKTSVLRDNDIMFDEEYFKRYILSEDMEFNCQFLKHTRDIVVSKEKIILYNWGVNNSISNSMQQLGPTPWVEDFILNDEEDIIGKYFNN